MTRALLLLFLAGLAAAQPPVHWWESEPLRIIDLVTSFGQTTLYPPAEAASRKAALGFDTEHLEIMELPGGLDDSGFFFSSRLASRRNEDYLAKYLPEAHRRGLRVIIYFNVHWYKRAFGERHRDWLQLREEGKPVENVYNTGTDFCLNSPWREWCFQILRELCAYPIDGIFYDGPIFFPDTCYCRWCRAKYRKLYGGDLPSKKERRGPAFAHLLEFQARSMAEFLRDSRRIIKTANPEIAFYMNGGVRGANWATARLNRTLIPELDLLGSEGGFLYGDLTRTPLWKPGLTARLLESQAGGKPRIIFSAAGLKPWTFSLLPGPELRLLYASTIANGAGVWFGMWPREFQAPEMEALAEMNRLLARTARYYTATRSAAETALVWSDNTANFYDGAHASQTGNMESEFSGLADALMRTHTPFDVIDDTTLEREDLSRYRAIFLPDVACLSERAAARISEWVRAGGRLFATFETSLYDETGVRRQDFALSGLFGASFAAGIGGPLRWDYMQSGNRLIPAPPYHVRVRENGGEVRLRFSRPMAGPYEGNPEPSPEPALIVRRVGGGTVTYFSGDLGNAIATFHFPGHLEFVADALPSPPVVVEGVPGSVEVTLRAQPGRRILHLVNFTGEMTRPIERIVPLREVRIKLREGGARAFTLVHPRELAIENGWFRIPRVDEYEVVVIESAGADKKSKVRLN